MTERAFYPRQESSDDEGLLELRYEGSRFSFKLFEYLNRAQKARTEWGRCDQTHELEKNALAYSEQCWPSGARLSIGLTENSKIYDCQYVEIPDISGVFTADHFAGFDNVGARFINVPAGRWARVPDISQAALRLVEPPLHNYSNYE